MIKTDFIKLYESLSELNEAAKSPDSIVAEIEADAKAFLQSSPLQEDADLDLDISDIEAEEAEADKRWRKNSTWLERVKTWFAEKVVHAVVKNEKLYNLVINNAATNGDGESYLMELIHDIQQLHFDNIEAASIKRAEKKGVDVSNLELRVVSKDN